MSLGCCQYFTEVKVVLGEWFTLSVNFLQCKYYAVGTFCSVHFKQFKYSAV